jgi:Glyoxalase-like domain
VQLGREQGQQNKHFRVGLERAALAEMTELGGRLRQQPNGDGKADVVTADTEGNQITILLAH